MCKANTHPIQRQSCFRPCRNFAFAAAVETKWKHVGHPISFGFPQMDIQPFGGIFTPTNAQFCYTVAAAWQFPSFKFHSQIHLNPKCFDFWGLPDYHWVWICQISSLWISYYEEEGLLNLSQSVSGQKPTSHSTCNPWSILCCLGLAQVSVIMIGQQYRACSSVLVDLLATDWASPMTHRDGFEATRRNHSYKQAYVPEMKWCTIQIWIHYYKHT